MGGGMLMPEALQHLINTLVHTHYVYIYDIYIYMCVCVPVKPGVFVGSTV